MIWWVRRLLSKNINDYLLWYKEYLKQIELLLDLFLVQQLSIYKSLLDPLSCLILTSRVMALIH